MGGKGEDKGEGHHHSRGPRRGSCADMCSPAAVMRPWHARRSPVGGSCRGGVALLNRFRTRRARATGRRGRRCWERRGAVEGATAKAATPSAPRQHAHEGAARLWYSHWYGRYGRAHPAPPQSLMGGRCGGDGVAVRALPTTTTRRHPRRRRGPCGPKGGRRPCGRADGRAGGRAGGRTDRGAGGYVGGSAARWGGGRGKEGTHPRPGRIRVETPRPVLWWMRTRGKRGRGGPPPAWPRRRGVDPRAAATARCGRHRRRRRRSWLPPTLPATAAAAANHPRHQPPAGATVAAAAPPPPSLPAPFQLAGVLGIGPPHRIA